MNRVLSLSRWLPTTTTSTKVNLVKRVFSLKGGALPDSEELRAFYALGINVGRQVGSELKPLLKKEELEVMINGFTDSLRDNVDDEKNILIKYGAQLNEILSSRGNLVVDAEKSKGEEFSAKYLVANPTAVKTSSGLIYLETEAGTGEQPTLESTVLVHYHGTLTDGSVFDSSKDRGEPIKFPLKNVIKGWQEGVSLMKSGGKATLVVPSSIAYGDSGSPPVIPPGATLVFEVELLQIV